MQRSSMARGIVDAVVTRALCALWAVALISCASWREPPDEAEATTSTTTAVASAASSGGARPAIPDSASIPVAGSPSRGRENALVTLVVFSDFECPYCQQLARSLASVADRFPEDVRIVFKHTPLSRHPHARLAAEAAMAAHAQGKFWEYHDVLFEQQERLERADLERYAEQLQLDMARFRADLDAHTHRATVDRDVALSRVLGVSSTPSMFANGTIIRGAKPIDHIQRVIGRVLSHARTITPRERVYAEMTAHPQPPDPQDMPEPPDPEFDRDAVHAIGLNGAPARGAAATTALVTMVVFSDFECGYCARLEPTLAELLRRHRNELRILFRHAPGSRHTHAIDAANFAEEARAQRGDVGFFAANDVLFAHQDELDRNDLLEYARELRLDLSRVNLAIAQQTHRPAIDRDTQLARQFGVDGTPTTFINGRRVLGARPIEEFEAAIQRALTDARAQVQQGVAITDVYERLTSSGSTRPVFRQGPAQVRVAHFLVMHVGSSRVPEGVTRTREQALARAQRAVAELRGGRPFVDIVREYSDEPGAGERGGDLGQVRRGMMVGAFEEAAFGLQVNETSGIVETEFGFHVIRRSE
ncbi:MAG: thioredoxin domain-containing protein [Myxococcales bacterium]|nr:thioredoxin domain-containing protein [Myxococcales bacterium]